MVVTVMTFASVSKTVPLQNGQLVGRVAESVFRGSGMVAVFPLDVRMCLPKRHTSSSMRPIARPAAN